MTEAGAGLPGSHDGHDGHDGGGCDAHDGGPHDGLIVPSGSWMGWRVGWMQASKESPLSE